MAKRRDRQRLLRKRESERKKILQAAKPSSKLGKLLFPTAEMVDRLVTLGVPRDLAVRMPRANAMQTLAAARVGIVAGKSSAPTGWTAGQWRQLHSEGREATEWEAAAIRRRSTGPYANERHH